MLKNLRRQWDELAWAKSRLEKLKSKVAQVAKRTREAKEKIRVRTGKCRTAGGEAEIPGRKAGDVGLGRREQKSVRGAAVAKVASVTRRLNGKASELDDLRDREKSLSVTLKEREAQRTGATRSLGETQSKLQRGTTIVEGIAGWQEKTKRLENIGGEKESQKNTKLEVQKSARRLRAEQQLALENEHRLSAKIGAIESKRGKLSDLVEDAR